MSAARINNPVNKGDLVAVVGAGLSGIAAVRLVLDLGARVRLLDKKMHGIDEPTRSFFEEHNVELIIGEHLPEHFLHCDLVVTSPGVPLKELQPLVAGMALLDPAEEVPPIISEMEVALPFVTAPIIAVTGTSGKTTTVSLIAAMLEKAGKKVFLGGNIGTPLCDFVRSKEQVDVIVLECSSFQLSTTSNLYPRVAVLLNLTENHLDQHTNMAEYTEAKLSLFANQTSDDLAIVQPEFLPLYDELGFRAKVTAFAPTKRFAQTQLAGSHNAANAEAAFIACSLFGVSEEEARQAVAEFAPLRHRLEFVCTKNGVRYFNDSKCTTVEALRVALTSFDHPIILLAGGKFKGGDLASLAPLVKDKVKAVFLYGACRENFEDAWHNTVPIEWSIDLDRAFAKARDLASEGEVVLLSPATASYDQYKNYINRGNHFCRLAKDTE